MSESEKLEAQGRAYAALKQRRSLVATLRTELSAFSQELRKLTEDLDRYARDPLETGSNGTSLYSHVRERLEELFEAGRRLRQVEKLHEEVSRERELQQQVDRF